MVNMHTPSAVEHGFWKKKKKKKKKKGIYQKFHFPFYFSSSQSVKVFIEGYPTSWRYCVVNNGVVYKQFLFSWVWFCAFWSSFVFTVFCGSLDLFYASVVSICIPILPSLLRSPSADTASRPLLVDY